MNDFRAGFAPRRRGTAGKKPALRGLRTGRSTALCHLEPKAKGLKRRPTMDGGYRDTDAAFAISGRAGRKESRPRTRLTPPAIVL